MLVLTRRRGQSLVLGDQIVVTVLDVSRGSVRLGIDAPRSIPVHRQEVLKAVAQEDHPAGANAGSASRHEIRRG